MSISKFDAFRTFITHQREVAARSDKSPNEEMPTQRLERETHAETHVETPVPKTPKRDDDLQCDPSPWRTPRGRETKSKRKSRSQTQYSSPESQSEVIRRLTDSCERIRKERNELLERNGELAQSNQDLRQNLEGSYKGYEGVVKLAKHNHAVAEERLKRYQLSDLLRGQLDKDIRREREKTLELKRQLIALKSERSESSHLDRQLTDEAIQSNLQALFYSIRDWTIEISKAQDPSKPSQSNLSPAQEFSSVDPRYPDVTEYAIHQGLSSQILGFSNDSTTQKRYALIAIISLSIKKLFDQCLVFGSPPEGSLAVANQLYIAMRGESQY